MKRSWISLTVSTLLIVIIIAGCEKYDEGGSLAKADKRITETLWKIESAFDLEDNVDITPDYAAEVWEFTGENEFKINSKLEGNYEFSPDQLTLIITELDMDTKYYRIERLDKDAMWLVELGEEELRFIPY